MQSERFEMRMSAGPVKAIDAWRRRQSDLPSRSEAMRRLIDAGLRAQKPARKAR